MDKDRRNIFRIAGISAAVLACQWPGNVLAADGGSAPMDIFTALATRRSVRAYTKEPVSDADLQKILEMAMLAPSAANERPWEFVVITDHDILDKVGDINHYAAYASKAPMAILLCLNKDKDKFGMGILDVGMCAENMMLGARGLGLGSVFTGIYPEKDRMEGFSKLVNLPANVIPVGLIILGHPQIASSRTPTDRFDQGSIHKNKW